MALQNFNLPQLQDDVLGLLSLPSHSLVLSITGSFYPWGRTTPAGALHAGTLGLVSADPGQILDTSTTIAPLSDLSVVRVDFALPERYFSRVGVGQAVDVITPAYPDQTFRGEVTVRAPVVEDDSRSFIVRAEIDNSDRRLVGGMFARTQLVFDTYDGLAVPDDAIISEGTATYVFTVSDGTATRTEVQTGASMGALTEITDGLSDGAQVVVTGWDDLSDGASVEVAEEVAREGLQ
ncbi:efflux RND transporter periplasmic adaptor subunit [Tranquillimonas alkanivorans]|uniref:efflux RND transporter periplasmic adaptor subunit n=1 Tax=Tranquillimonas alkanivorans TaxID=441119 RepID=UPI000B82B511